MDPTNDNLPTEKMALNIGPAHPATHGALRFFVELDGETITKAATEIGYLHRAFEKHSEHSTWSQVIPYTDRLNYCSSFLNNVGYCFPSRSSWTSRSLNAPSSSA